MKGHSTRYRRLVAIPKCGERCMHAPHFQQARGWGADGDAYQGAYNYLDSLTHSMTEEMEERRVTSLAGSSQGITQVRRTSRTDWSAWVMPCVCQAHSMDTLYPEEGTCNPAPSSLQSIIVRRTLLCPQSPPAASSGSPAAPCSRSGAPRWRPADPSWASPAYRMTCSAPCRDALMFNTRRP